MTHEQINDVIFFLCLPVILPLYGVLRVAIAVSRALAATVVVAWEDSAH